MAVVRTQIAVARCTDCPFFERTGVNVFADWLIKRPPSSGTCKYHADGQQWPIGRVAIADSAAIPSGCPLRHGDVVIQLKAAP